MKEKISYLEYNNVKYPMIFTINVMEEIQEEYGTFKKWNELTRQEEPNIKAIKFGLTSMINEGIAIENETAEKPMELVSLSQAGRIVTSLGLKKTAAEISKNVVESAKTGDEPKNE